MPSEVRVEADEFENEGKRNPEFAKALQAVREDERFKKHFHHSLIKHKNRYINEYVFYIENEEESLQFFLIQNKKTESVTIIDYLRK